VDLDAELARHADRALARDAGKDPSVVGRRDQRVAAECEDVRPLGLEHAAVAVDDEWDLTVEGARGRLEQPAVRPLVATEPAVHRDRRERDAGLGRREDRGRVDVRGGRRQIERSALVGGEGQAQACQRQDVGRRGPVVRGRAIGALRGRGCGDAASRFRRAREREGPRGPGDARHRRRTEQLAGARGQAIEVGIELDRPAVDDEQRLEDPALGVGAGKVRR
jgi:hypothetical protein